MNNQVWSCACGAAGMTGKFCAECGSPKSAASDGSPKPAVTPGGSERKYSPPPLPAPEGKVISLSLGGGHMSRFSFYNFYLREKNGQVLFDARFWAGGKEIALGNAAAAQEDMDALRTLCEQYALAERQRTYCKPIPGSGPFMYDAPMRSLDVRWENGARLDAGIDFGNLDDLRDFLEALAVRIYEAKPRPAGEIVSLHVFNGDHFVKTDYYRFRIRQKEGQVLLDALYYLGDNESFDEVNLEGVAVFPEDMAHLRAICARYDLAARQRSYAWPMMPPFGPIAQAKYGWQLEVIWANGVQLDCEKTFVWNGRKYSGLMEDLKDFFIALGNKHS